MSLFYSPRIVIDGLILLLDAANPKSYPGSGTTWFDISGRDNHFSLVGSLTHSNLTGFTGFTQTNRWFKNSFPTNLKLSQGGLGLTTCVWARCTGVGGWQKLIGNGDEQSYIDLYASSGGGLWHQEDNSTLYVNTSQVNNDSFYMADGQWRMYSTTNTNFGSVTNPTDAFGIGSEGDAAYNYPWIGNIAAVMLYNRVLTTSELAQNYNAYRGRFNV